MNKTIVLAGQEIKNVRAFERFNAAGRTMGTRILYTGNLPASEIKKQLRAAKVPAKDIKAKVNSILAGKESIAWVTYGALKAAEEQSVRDRGGLPEMTDHNAKGTKSTTTYVFPEKVTGKEKALPAPEPVTPTEEGKKYAIAALVATGMTHEEASAKIESLGL